MLQDCIGAFCAPLSVLKITDGEVRRYSDSGSLSARTCCSSDNTYRLLMSRALEDHDPDMPHCSSAAVHRRPTEERQVLHRIAFQSGRRAAQ